MLMALFILGNLTSAIAENYSILMLGRIIAALCHGAFFSIGAVVAAGMVHTNKQAAAISIMFLGLTVSNVMGVPVGTFLGLKFGWRSTFWVLAIIGIITMFGIRLLVPVITVDNKSNLKNEFRVFKSPQVWISIFISIFTFGGVIGGFTYIAFILTKVSQFQTSSVPWLLVLFGFGTFIGNIIGGKMADKALNKSIAILLTFLAIVLAIFALTAENQTMTVISLFLMGSVGLAIAPGLQLRIMKYAPDAPTAASGANIAAFNIGNALGAWFGGITLNAGFGFTSPLWAGVVLSLTGLIILSIGVKLNTNKPSYY